METDAIMKEIDPVAWLFSRLAPGGRVSFDKARRWSEAPFYDSYEISDPEAGARAILYRQYCDGMWLSRLFIDGKYAGGKGGGGGCTRTPEEALAGAIEAWDEQRRDGY